MLGLEDWGGKSHSLRLTPSLQLCTCLVGSAFSHVPGHAVPTMSDVYSRHTGFQLFQQQARQLPASGSQHVLFPLPGMLFCIFERGWSLVGLHDSPVVCSSSRAFHFNIHLPTFTDKRSLWGKKEGKNKTKQKRSLWRSDMTKVTQLVMRTAQKCWNPSCPQSPSSQPSDQSSQYTFVLHACSSLCPMKTTGTLLSQQNSRPHFCVIMCVSHSRQQGPCLSLILQWFRTLCGWWGWRMGFLWHLPIVPARAQQAPLNIEN